MDCMVKKTIFLGQQSYSFHTAFLAKPHPPPQHHPRNISTLKMRNADPQPTLTFVNGIMKNSIQNHYRYFVLVVIYATEKEISAFCFNILNLLLVKL